TMKMLATVLPTCSATSAASSSDAPPATASAASQRQHDTPKLAVPVSTNRPLGAARRAARRAALIVPDTADPMCTDRISSTPRDATRAYASENRPGLGCDVDTSGRPDSKRA